MKFIESRIKKLIVSLWIDAITICFNIGVLMWRDSRQRNLALIKRSTLSFWTLQCPEYAHQHLDPKTIKCSIVEDTWTCASQTLCQLIMNFVHRFNDLFFELKCWDKSGKPRDCYNECSWALGNSEFILKYNICFL